MCIECQGLFNIKFWIPLCFPDIFVPSSYYCPLILSKLRPISFSFFSIAFLLFLCILILTNPTKSFLIIQVKIYISCIYQRNSANISNIIIQYKKKLKLFDSFNYFFYDYITNVINYFVLDFWADHCKVFRESFKVFQKCCINTVNPKSQKFTENTLFATYT